MKPYLDLLDLPNELLEAIGEAVDNASDLANLARCSKHCTSIFRHVLFRVWKDYAFDTDPDPDGYHFWYEARPIPVSRQEPPIVWAVRKEKPDSVKALLHAGADISQPAVEVRTLEILGRNPNAIDSTECTVSHWAQDYAITNHDASMMRLLFDYNVGLLNSWCHHRGYERCNFHWARARPRTDTFNIATCSMRPLESAYWGASIECVQALGVLARQHKHVHSFHWFYRLLEHSARRGEVEMLSVLLDEYRTATGGRITHKTLQTLLCEATKFGRIEVMQMLLGRPRITADAVYRKQSRLGHFETPKTAVAMAAYGAQVEALKFLFDSGASIHLVDGIHSDLGIINAMVQQEDDSGEIDREDFWRLRNIEQMWHDYISVLKLLLLKGVVVHRVHPRPQSPITRFMGGLTLQSRKWPR